jgi:polygalacturonase
LNHGGIFISDCKIRSSASALKFGTASRGGFQHIIVRNIQVYDTYRSAIALEAVDGGILEDVDIRNVNATNTGSAVFIRLGHRNKDSVVSKIRHIYISNVKVFVPAGKPDKGYTMEGPVVDDPHNVYPSSIAGLPGHPVEDVALDSFDIVYEGGANKDRAYFNPDSLSRITENNSGYPEFSMFGELPVWGLFIRHATDIKLKNFTLGYEKDDFRSAMIMDDVNNISLQNVSIQSGKNTPVLIFNDTKNIILNNLHLPVQSKEAIKYTAKNQ